MIYAGLVVNFDVKLTLHDFNTLFYLTKQNKYFLLWCMQFCSARKLNFRTELNRTMVVVEPKPNRGSHRTRTLFSDTWQEPEPNWTLVVLEPEQNRTRAIRVLSHLYSQGQGQETCNSMGVFRSYCKQWIQNSMDSYVTVTLCLKCAYCTRDTPTSVREHLVSQMCTMWA